MLRYSVEVCNIDCVNDDDDDDDMFSEAAAYENRVLGGAACSQSETQSDINSYSMYSTYAQYAQVTRLHSLAAY